MSQSDDDFQDSFDDELDQVLNKPTTVNRHVQESIIRRNEPAQRTLMGERVQPNDQVQYEEIHREVTYGPTHHKMNQLDLNTFIYPSNLEMRDYQYDIIVKSFYKNLLCAIPTGMGKTFIASTVMLNYYRWFKEGKIIFMAPTRPLVAQQIQACLGVTDIPSSDTAILLDKTRKNRPDIWNSKRVFFTTPQVVENDLKTGILSPKDIICLVIDEAHRARGNYAYTNVVQFIDRFNTSYRVLALTATPAADIEGVQEVVNNLHISQIEIRTEESIDISKYMKRKETVRIRVGLNSEMEDIIELLTEAIDPILKQANEANIYEVSDASRINAFHVMQKSQAIVRNPTLHEGTKWKYYYILQVIGFVGQMLRRLKIYGVRTFYSYFQNKCKEFRTKYDMGKSTNRLSAGFFYHDALKKIEATCDKVLSDPSYVSHPKLEHMIDELLTFFQHKKSSRVIVFTELRESALEIVKCIDNVAGSECKAHIFIGQARAKDGFDEEEYVRKHGPKGRGKQKRLEREEKERQALERKEQEKQAAAQERAASRTATSEEAQLQGMNQKTQKELIKKFKKGDFSVLVATSIGEEGLDIGEVDLIICYDSTSSPIKNIQRMGRTGRKNDGKVILLLASTEELKFDQSMEGYSFVQKQIAQNALDMHKSDRIIPKEIQPRCLKQLIDVPEENLKIVRGEDEDEVIKYATQAMLGKNQKTKKAPTKKGSTKSGKLLGTRGAAAQNQQQPKITKKFFMPDNVDVGFVKSSKLVKKVGGDTSGNTSISVDSDEDEADTSANISRSSAKSIAKQRLGTNSSFLNNKSDSSPSINHNSNAASGTASRRAFFRPDFNAMEEPVRRIDSEINSDNESSDDHDADPVRSDDESEIEDQPSKVTEQTDDVGEEEDNFPKALTPEYERDDFLASSPKQPADDNDEIEDSADEITSVRSDDEDINELGLQEEKASKAITPQKRKSSPVMSGKKHHKLNGNEALDSLLSFKAFEENHIEQETNHDNFSYVQPYQEAAKVMDKQYEDDPEFNAEPSFENSVPTKPKKRTSKTPRAKKISVAQEKSATKKKQKDVDNTVDTAKPKLDITSLLKESSRKPKRSLGARRRKVDISKISKEQIIDLDLESQSQANLREVLPKRRKKSVEPPLYLSQKDLVVDNFFDKDDGFLTEEEKQVFFSEYFTHVDVGELILDPKLAAKNTRRIGSINHSRYAQRFINLIRMTSSKHKLEQSITQLTQNADARYKDEILPTDVIVGEDQIEYVKPKSKSEPVEPIEIDDESDGDDSLLDNDRPGGAGFTSISLLSDDDEEFKGL